MRLRSLLLPLALVAAVGHAQTVGTAASGSIGSSSSIGVTSSLSNIAPLGRLPAPLGSTQTLSERIDRAAGLGTSRARGGISLPATLRPEGRIGSGTGGGLLTGGSAIDTAGRPAGAPFGTTSQFGGNPANTLPR